MCEPISATAMAWISVGTAAVGLYAQQETAKAQSEAIGNQQDAERDEIHEKSEEELGVRIKEAREKRARARVAAGESGALGASFAASINQSLADQDNTVALVQKNVAFAQRAVDDRANTALAGIRSPSALEAGLSIAGAGASGYSSGLSLEARRKAAATGSASGVGRVV
jgi:hypothetical protein